MKIVFVSNYYNHHQSYIAHEFNNLTHHNFWFIETIPMEQERKNLGWGNENKPNYVLQSYISSSKMAQCQKMINDADAVIWGSCPFKMIKYRLKKKKLTFLYSERLFKDNNFVLNILRTIKYNILLRPYTTNHYLLCASAYTKKDYNRIGLFKDKAFQWGYFPETKTYGDVEDLILTKEKNVILWVARFIELKHPEIAIMLAKHLKENGYHFKLDMIGTGPLLEDIKHQIVINKLTEHVHILGVMSPQEVRHRMEKSDIFIFTSDRHEGWGAVLNEAMNSACSVIANKQIGSVPFLISDQMNGFVYDDKNIDGLFFQVECLLKEPQAFYDVKKNAYFTIHSKWNSSMAATNFIAIASGFLSNAPVLISGNQPCAKL